MAAVLILCLRAAPLPAALLHVTPSGTGDGSLANPASLRIALDTARTNGEDDVILVQRGYYGPCTYVYDAKGSDNKAVRLSGGWCTCFLTQSEDPTLTILDANYGGRVLKIDADAPGAVADFTLEHLTLQKGKCGMLGPYNNDHGGNIRVWTRTATPGVHGSAILKLHHCLLQNGLVTGGLWGGAVYVGGYTDDDHATAAKLTRCTFTDNTSYLAQGPGTAVHNAGVAMEVEGCTFSGRLDGTSTSGTGSTLYHGPGATAKILNSAFTRNLVDFAASAVEFHDSDGEIVNCLFANNTAGMANNSASNRGAVACASTGGPVETVRIVSSTFVGNRSQTGTDHGAVFSNGANVQVVNSIFRDNMAHGLGCTGGCTGTLDYSAVEGGAAGQEGFTYGAGNTDQDPKFAAGDLEYRLASDSPCIDAGDNGAAGLPATDFEGDPRVFLGLGGGSSPVTDMGWDEYYNGALALQGPLGGESWASLSTHTLSWAALNIGDQVNLLLFKGGAVLRILAAGLPASPGAYAWTIPKDLPAGTDYRIAVQAALYPTVIGSHATPVTITPVLVLRSPNGGQKWTQGRTYRVRWRAGGFGGAPVRIDLFAGSKYARCIAKAAPDTGSLLWTVPHNLAAGYNYRARISAGGIRDWSNSKFALLSAITVTSPNGGQRWRAGTAHRITWTYRGRPSANVRIELFDRNRVVRVVKARAPIGSYGKGSFLWLIPGTQRAGSTYRIRVRSTSFGVCCDLSNRYFTITRP